MAKKNLEEYIKERLQDLDPVLDVSPGSSVYSKVIAPLLVYVGEDPFNTDFVSFAQARIAEACPTFAAEGGDPLNELLLTGTTVILEPIAREIWQVHLRSGLRDLDYHTEESLEDKVSGAFIERDGGEYSRGVARLYFSSPRYVPATMEKMFHTASGLNFYPSSSQYITAAQMLYNKEGEYYYFDVRLIAQFPGSEYNVSSGKIVGVSGIEGVEKVLNKNAFRNGAARESNDELYARAQNAPNEAAPNTDRGVIAIIRDNFPSITYLQTIGYGDEEMIRDMIKGGGFGPLLMYAYAAAHTIEMVEDGDYNGKSARLYVTPLALTFVELLGGLGIPPKPAVVSLAYTPTGGTETRTDFEVIEVLDDNTLVLDTEIEQGPGIIQHMDLRYKSLTISDIPLHAYPTSFGPFEVSESAHIGGVIDVWVRDPEPVEKQILLPSVSDESYYSSGDDASLKPTGFNDECIYLYDAEENAYYSGTTIAVTIPNWLDLQDINVGADPIPMELHIGDLIWIESGGAGETGYYEILEIDITNYATTHISVKINFNPGGGLTAYKLCDFARQFKKGWIVSLLEGEAGLYKILNKTNFVVIGDKLRPAARLTVDNTFSLDQDNIDYKVYDNFEINLSEPKNIRIEASDLKCILGSYVVESLTAMDFSVLGVQENDTLRIATGNNAGDYTIKAVVGALHNKLHLTTPTPFAEINASYKVFEGLDGIELPCLRLKDVSVIDSSGSSIPIPCRDVLTCLSRGISNLGAGERLKVNGITAGLVSDINGTPPYLYAVDTWILDLKIRRRSLLSWWVDEQVIPYSVTFASVSQPPPDLTLAEVIAQINTQVNSPIAMEVDGHLVLRPLADEAILVANTATAGALGFNTGCCAIHTAPSPYAGWYMSYGIHLKNEVRPENMGKNDWVYFPIGSNVGELFKWEDLPTNTQHIILEPFCGLHPQPDWLGSTVIIGYPSSGYFRLYFKEATKAVIDTNSVITVTTEEGVEKRYVPDPNKYAVLSPPTPETTRWSCKKLWTAGVSNFVAFSSVSEAKNIRGLLPREFLDHESIPYVQDTDTINFLYRRVWFDTDIAGPGPWNVAGETLSFAVDNGPVLTVTFVSVSLLHPDLTSQEIVDQINEVFPDVAEIDKDSDPPKEFICLYSQYLINNIAASAGLTAAIGALVPAASTDNKSINYGVVGDIVSVNVAGSGIVINTALIDEGFSFVDSKLDAGATDGNPKVQYELRRYGAQGISSEVMSEQVYVGYPYMDLDVISIGIGDTFNLDAEEVGEINQSQALGYSLSTTPALAFSTMEPLIMDITTVISEVGVNSAAYNDKIIADSVQIDQEHSELTSDVQDFITMDTERVLCASTVAKHMIPHYINSNMVYTGGPTKADALADITALIEALRAGERIEISDVINLLTNRGATYVQTPVVLAVLAQDVNRKQKLYLIEDTSELGSLTAFYINSINLIRQ